MAAATRGLALGKWVHNAGGLLLLATFLTLVLHTRLPMVAGWDRLLPAWFARLHEKYSTPLNSILFVGAVTLAFGLVSLIGVGHQEAFQLLDNAATVFYSSTYMVLFAIPVIGNVVAIVNGLGTALFLRGKGVTQRAV